MASLLETFFILFESDADKAAKGLDDVEKAADGAADGLEETTKQSEEANKSFGKTIKAAAGVATALGLVTAANKALQLTQQVDQLGKYADLWGKNVSSINAWQQANMRAGGSAAEMLSTIESLNSGLNEIALTGEGSLLPFLNLFGISAIDAAGKARDAFSVLPELADRFASLNDSEAATLGQQLGLDDATIRMLKMGRREVELMIQRQERLGVVTKAQAEASADFNDSLGDTGQIFGTLGRRLITAALPALTAFLDSITDIMVFMNEHETLMIGFFGTIASVITTLYLPAMLKAAAATLAAAAPFILVAAAIAAAGAAIGLFLDDLENWRAGNDSLLGGALGDWRDFSEMVGQVIDGMVSRVFGGIDKIKDGWESLKGFFTGKYEAGQLLGKQLLAEAANSPLGASTSQSIANNTSNGGNRTVQIDKVEVVTQATDAEGVAADISKTLKQQMKQTVVTFDDGLNA